MYPVIIEIGPVKIYSFGLMLVCAFYTCFFLINYDLKKLKYKDELASDLVFFSALGGIAGAKVYYLIENISRTIQDPISMIFSGSGLVFLGGLIGGTLGVSYVINKEKLNWFKIADVIAPTLMIGYAIGRIGCFLVGDDYGLPTKSLFGMSFPNGLPPTTSTSFSLYYPWVDISSFEPGLLKVHPTQLYESLIGFILFYILWVNRLKNIHPGNIFFLYMIFAGIERFLIEFIRTNHKYLFDLFSGAQVISVFMILIGSYFIIKPLKNNNPDI